jgi:hypothetical protein
MLMKITAKSFYVGISTGLLVGFLAGIPPVVIDLYENPSGIFRTESGTNWAFVFDTWFSWFWPVAIASVPVVFLIHAWALHRRTVNAT